MAGDLTERIGLIRTRQKQHLISDRSPNENDNALMTDGRLASSELTVANFDFRSDAERHLIGFSRHRGKSVLSITRKNGLAAYPKSCRSVAASRRFYSSRAHASLYR
jgi:hypothetical protein